MSGGRTLGGRRPRVVAEDGRGWTLARQARFLEELAATCNVSAALRAVGLTSPGSLYRLRRRDAAFRARWRAALAEGYARLELTLLDRALNGTVKTVERAGGAIDRTVEYPNALGLALLRMHAETASAAEAEEPAGAAAELRTRIARKIAALAARLAPADEAAGADGPAGAHAAGG